MSVNLPPTIAANIDQFTGRTWLLPKVLDWYEESRERIFLVTGGPGTGKSMIMAWLAGSGPSPDDPVARQQLEQVRAQVKAAHFCIAASGSTAPKALAQNLAEQLTRSVPGFADALAASLADLVTITPVQKVEKMDAGASMTGVQIGTLNLAGLAEELSFNRALREPLQKLYENGYDEPMLLMVDALDEALTYTGAIDIVELLAKLKDLPAQVRILVSTRPDPRVLKRFRQAKRVDLIEDAPPDADDVQAYASGRLARVEGMSAAKIEAFANRIAKAAGGIFLYAAIVLDELQPRLPRLPDLDRYPLPDGLSGLYYDFLNRELGRDEDRWYEQFRPVLGLIAVAQGDGLTARQLEAISGKEVEQTLRICRQYLSGEWPGGPFRCFHRSFVDWLLEDEENVDYHIDGTQMHRKIADYYRGQVASWDHIDWRAVDDYGLRHLSGHLCRVRETADNRRELYQLICKPLMEEMRRRTFSHRSFIETADTVIEAAAGDLSPTGTAQLVRICLVAAILRESASYAPQLALIVLTQLGQVAEARGYADVMQRRDKRIIAYTGIGSVLLEHMKLKEAVELADLVLSECEFIKDQESKVRALTWSAHALRECGYMDRAKDIAQRVLAAEAQLVDVDVQAMILVDDRESALEHIKDSWARARAEGHWRLFGWVVAVLIQLEEIDLALQASSDLLKLLHVVDDREKGETLADIASMLAKSGEKRMVAELVTAAVAELSLEDGKPWMPLYNWSMAVGDAAQALLYLGHLNHARELVQSALDQIDKVAAEYLEGAVDILSMIAPVVTQVGEAKRSLDTILRLLDLADLPRTLSGLQQADVLSGLADSLVSLNEKARAIRIAERAAVGLEVIDPYLQTRAYAAVAKALSGVGQIDRALLAFGLIEDEWLRCEALESILLAMGRARRIEQMRKLARLHTGSMPDTLSLEIEAVALVYSGLAEQAVELAGKVRQESSRAGVLGKIIRALICIDDKTKVADVAGLILAATVEVKEWTWREKSLVRLSELMVEGSSAEGLDDVLAAAFQMNGTVFVISGIALALAQAGEHVEAVKIAETAIDRSGRQSFWGGFNVHERGFILGRLGKSLALAGECAKAATLVNDALECYAACGDDGTFCPREIGLSLTGWASVACKGVNGALVAATASRPKDRPDLLGGMAQALVLQGDRNGLRRLVEVAEMTADRGAAARSLAKLGRSFIVVGDSDEGWQVLTKAFQSAALANQRSVVRVLEDAAIELAKVEQGEKLWQICEAVREVMEWWPRGSRAYR